MDLFTPNSNESSFFSPQKFDQHTYNVFIFSEPQLNKWKRINDDFTTCDLIKDEKESWQI